MVICSAVPVYETAPTGSVVFEYAHVFRKSNMVLPPIQHTTGYVIYQST